MHYLLVRQADWLLKPALRADILFLADNLSPLALPRSPFTESMLSLSSLNRLLSRAHGL